jgi:hypothetical protein
VLRHVILGLPFLLPPCGATRGLCLLYFHHLAVVCGLSISIFDILSPSRFSFSWFSTLCLHVLSHLATIFPKWILSTYLRKSAIFFRISLVSFHDSGRKCRRKSCKFPGNTVLGTRGIRELTKKVYWITTGQNPC